MIGGESRYLSLIAAGSFTHAAFGGESAGGDGSPEFEVCQNIPSGLIPLVAIQPPGRTGGVTLSKLSNRLHAIGLGLAVGVDVGVGVSQATSMYCWLSFVPVPGAELPAIAQNDWPAVAPAR